MNRKAVVGTQGESGALGTLHTPALPWLCSEAGGNSVHPERVQPWPGMGASFQLFVVPLLLAATGHGKE